MDHNSDNIKHREGETSFERTLMMESSVVGSQNGMEVSEKPEIEMFYDSPIHYHLVLMNDY